MHDLRVQRRRTRSTAFLVSLLLTVLTLVAAPATAATAAGTRSISGSVYLDTGATPAPGVQVEFTKVGQTHAPADFVTTDANGAYTIAGLDSVPYYVRFHYTGAAGYVDQWPGASTYPWGGDAVDSGAVLDLSLGNATDVWAALQRPGTITGTVSLGTTGTAPAAGDVRVSYRCQRSLSPNLYDLPWSTPVAVPAGGAYSIPDVAPSSLCQLYFEYLGTGDYHSWYYTPNNAVIPWEALNSAFEVYGRLTVVKDMVIPAKFTTTGTVKLGTGGPVAGAGEVVITARDAATLSTVPGIQAQTDAAGHYSVSGLWSGLELVYTYTGTGDFRVTTTASARYQAGGDVTIPKAFRVSGRVSLDAAGNYAGAGVVKVNLTTQAGTDVTTTMTDADGRYQLDDVDPGTYVISFTHQTDPSYPTWYLSDSTPGGSPFTGDASFVVGSTRTDGDVVIDPGVLLPGISGVVRDYTSALAVGGVEVTLVQLERYGPNLGDFVAAYDTTTAADGTYAFPRLDDQYFYYVVFEKAGYAYQAWPDSGEFYAPGLIVLDDGSASDIDVYLYDSASIGGKVTAPSLPPSAFSSGLVTAELLVKNGLTQLWERTGYIETVAADGTYTMTDLGPDTYRIRFAYNGNVLVTSSDITIHEGQSKTYNAQVVTTRDMSGDSVPDILGRTSAGWMYRWTGNGSGGTNAPAVSLGSGWNGMNLVFQAGDFDGDLRNDVLARDSVGRLWLFPGRPDGSWGAPQLVGTGWNGFTALFSPGDFDGDGKTDVIGRLSNGALYLYRSSGTGGWLGSSIIGSGWNGFSILLGPGDFDGDGASDVMGRLSNGDLYLYPGNGHGGWLTPRIIGNGWNGFAEIIPAGDFDRDGRTDVFGRDSIGRLWLYRGSGNGAWLGGTPISTGWSGIRLVS